MRRAAIKAPCFSTAVLCCNTSPPPRGVSTRQTDAPKRENSFVLLRHGESKPNVRGIIVSLPSAGVEEQHGLTAKGKEQAVLAGQQLEELANTSGQKPLLVSSDFSRAYETASAALSQISDSSEVRVDTRLRERFFGRYEGQSSALYEEVWKQDEAMGSGAPHLEASGADGAESVYAVSARMSEVVKELDALFENRLITLVSHGDALQVLQTHFMKMPPWQHRRLQHLNNCELRPMPTAKEEC